MRGGKGGGTKTGAGSRRQKRVSFCIWAAGRRIRWRVLSLTIKIPEAFGLGGYGPCKWERLHQEVLAEKIATVKCEAQWDVSERMRACCLQY